MGDRGCGALIGVLVSVVALVVFGGLGASSQNSGIGPSGFNMYEISTRPWLYNLSLSYGYNISRLADIPPQEFQALADMGIDMVWMMGVWHLGPYGLNLDRTTPSLLQEYAQVLPGYTTEDIIGSPYAVTNYTCNPELGTDEDIQALRKMLNSMGLLLMLDFVPNHSAVDCPWTTTNMDYYVRAPPNSGPPYNSNQYLPNGIAYGSDGYGDAWMDTAQLNYWNPALVQARIDQLLYVASLADAIRCDVAYLVLNDQIAQNWGSQMAAWGYTQPSEEFWSVAISAVKQTYPDVIFLGEVYYPLQPALQAVGFDYTYDKSLLDNLVSQNVGSVSGWLGSNSDSFITHSAHFLSNHDEVRAVAAFGEWYIADAAALVTYTLPGMRFFWEGDFNGFSAKLDIHLRRETDEPTNLSVWDFYAINLFPIISDPVFKYGTWSGLLPIQNSDGGIMAWGWQYKNEKRLCVLNFTPNQDGGAIVVSNAEAVNGNDTIPVTDLLSGVTYYRSATAMRTTGLDVLVNSWWAQIFTY